MNLNLLKLPIKICIKLILNGINFNFLLFAYYINYCYITCLWRDNMILIILFVVVVLFSIWSMLRMASISDEYDANIDK